MLTISWRMEGISWFRSKRLALTRQQHQKLSSLEKSRNYKVCVHSAVWHTYSYMRCEMWCAHICHRKISGPSCRFIFIIGWSARQQWLCGNVFKDCIVHTPSTSYIVSFIFYSFFFTAEQLKPQEQLTLEPYERDHAVVVGIYRAPKKA